MSDLDEAAHQAQALADRIKPLLAGQDPTLQGAALAELVSLWIAGHYQYGPEMLETILAQFIQIVEQLTPPNIEMIKGSRQ